jgi:chromate transporter
LFSTAAFLGFLLGGWPGAAAASIGIFLPSFILVGATHGLVKRLRDAPWSAGFMDGLNAGSVGLMAGVLVQLAQAAMGVVWTWPILAIAGILLMRTKVNPAWIVVGAGVIGVAVHAGVGR